MSLDEETLRLYEEMKAAARDGNLLAYAGNLAKAMVGRTEVRREPETTRRSLFEPPVEIRSVPPITRPPTPAPIPVRRGVNDGVRVGNL